MMLGAVLKDSKAAHDASFGTKYYVPVLAPQSNHSVGHDGGRTQGSDGRFNICTMSNTHRDAPTGFHTFHIANKGDSVYRFLSKVFCQILKKHGQLNFSSQRGSPQSLIAMEKHLARYYKRFCVTGKLKLPVCLQSLYYVDKIFRSFEEPPKIYPGSEVKLLTVSLILAHKVNVDHAYSNKTWSRLTGFATSDLSRLEMEVLAKLNYSLFISVEEYARWTKVLYLFANSNYSFDL